MLSISEIRSRASAFSQRWKDEVSEDAEAKSFWDEFLNVFGIDRKRVAAFEKQVAKAGDKSGFIDLFWPGVLIVEHKSAGKDLSRAFSQAIDYFPGLKDYELPRYVIVSDFRRLRLHDLVERTDVEILLADLPERIDLFGFISGYVPRTFREEDPVNVRAAELMGRLHDAIKATGYVGHELEVFLTRLLFCLFGDDTGIFRRDSFVTFLETKTREDGLDVGSSLSFLFQILNTPEAKRPSNLDDEFKAFPYVNGQLFAETLPMPHFDATMRARLLECANFDWTYVSPAVFGAMFQGVMNNVQRRNLGAHYTSEKNILKVVSGLFLDEIDAELEAAKNSEHRLRALHERLARMRFLDPACGCGNFLIVTYKELRRIEIAILQRLDALGALSGRGQLVADISALSRLSVRSMFGIELEEFPARIAEVALWLIDHIMNVELAKAFGGYFVRLPLTEGPTILIADALETDWRTTVLNTVPDAEWFILGNPPFVGKTWQSTQQKQSLAAVVGDVKGGGILDFVCGWWLKAARLLQQNRVEAVGFVSTNSVCQGEHVGVLWPHLLRDGVRIAFAYTTFKWTSEARGTAAVHAIVVGLDKSRGRTVQLFVASEESKTPTVHTVPEITPYLFAGSFIKVVKRGVPLQAATPKMSYGCMPNDGGYLLFGAEDRLTILNECPKMELFIRKVLGSESLINGHERYCLWLKDAPPEVIRSCPKVMQRIEAVRKVRTVSTRQTTRDLARYPYLFGEIRQPQSSYLGIPRVSSESRRYVPIGLIPQDVIPLDQLYVVDNATLYGLGIITSTMHMAWMRTVAGRLKSDYQYSAGLVYNNYPWPEPTQAQREKVEALAQGVLDARAKHPTSTLADLYHPTTMPPDLRKAHEALDKAVDQCYRKEPFTSERERVEYLFDLYRTLTEGFAAEVGKKRKGRKEK